MAKLEEQHQVFIVQQLACFKTPSQAAAAVKEEFGIDVDRAKAQFYDPTKGGPGKKLAKKWKEIFFQTREQYVFDVAGVGVAHQRYRLDTLQAVIDRQLTKATPNDVLLMSALEQAAKEAGGAFTNRRELTGKGGGPIEAVSMTVDQWQDQAAKRRSDAMSGLAAFEGDDA